MIEIGSAFVDASWAHGLQVLAGGMDFAAALPTFDEVVAWLRTLHLATVWAICFGVLLLCGFGLPVPEDITLVTCGYLTYLLAPPSSSAADGWTLALVATAVGMAGVMIGDLTMFTLGRRYGDHLAGVWPFRAILGHGRKQMAEEFLARRGPHVLFSARFMPGLRSVVFFTSGTLKVEYGVFLRYDGLAALLSVPALVLTSWYFGDQIAAVIDYARRAEHGILAAIILTVAAVALKYWWGQRKKRIPGE
ncbi:MAG: DedA family protein [Deltaproteobacteria bacterium]|nr:DedA family protein [Deltaproteobacteria bacterium]